MFPVIEAILTEAANISQEDFLAFAPRDKILNDEKVLGVAGESIQRLYILARKCKQQAMQAARAGACRIDKDATKKLTTQTRQLSEKAELLMALCQYLIKEDFKGWDDDTRTFDIRENWQVVAFDTSLAEQKLLNLGSVLFTSFPPS